jgi:hypothetical protein
MPEQLTCPCCASPLLVILPMQVLCMNCGFVIAGDLKDAPIENPQVRPKLDRRSQPR